MADTVKLLRLEELAHRLGISYTQARMLVLYDEKIPYMRVGSRGIRVKEEDFEAYIAKQEQKKEEVPSGSKSAPPKEIYEGRKVLNPEEKK